MDSIVSDTGALSFEEYAAANWPSLFRYAYLLTGNHSEAEDLAQQTLIKVHGGWKRVRSADSPQAYVRRMLTNAFVSQRRPKKRRLEVLTDAPPEGPIVTNGSDPEDRMALWPHVEQLPPRQRAVIVLRYYEDLSEQEIADVLDCSTGTVKSSAHHALKTLRAAIEADAKTDSDSPSGNDRKEA